MQGEGVRCARAWPSPGRAEDVGVQPLGALATRDTWASSRAGCLPAWDGGRVGRSGISQP